MRCLARLILAAIVASGTRNARAISAVVRPPTARSVRAVWEAAVSVGWQHRNSRTSVSSVPGTSSGGTSVAVGRLPLAARVVTAHLVDEPPGRDSHQPAARVVRHSPVRPLHGGGEDGLLYGVLTPFELAVPAYQRAEDLRRELTQQVLEGWCRHASNGPSANITCRTSTPRPSIAASGICAASSIARSLFSQSIR